MYLNDKFHSINYFYCEFFKIKYCIQVAPLLKELALSECLVLKHLYNAIFSPSSTQRYISRFLIATWTAGQSQVNPAKALLLRILPSGLTEYLKYASITDEQRKNLDLLEAEFYATFANSGSTHWTCFISYFFHPFLYFLIRYQFLLSIFSSF